MSIELGRFSHLNGKLQQMIESVEQCAGAARYVVYAIIDPTREDPCRVYPGVPVYVGETGVIGVRIGDHLHRACSSLMNPSGPTSVIQGLMAHGIVPPFAILERFGTKFEARQAEILWSQDFLRRGYPLTNRYSWQNTLLDADMLKERLTIEAWSTALCRAIEAGLRIVASCEWCGRTSALQPSEFVGYFGRRAPLRSIAEMTESCVSCGCENKHRIVGADEEVREAPGCSLDWEE